MNCLAKSLFVALAFAGLTAGCATYDYGYSQPYYGYNYGYDYGPYYYGGPSYYYGPGYYVGPPVVGFNFGFSDRDRHFRSDRHERWSGDRGRWHSGSYTPSPTARARASAPHVASAPATAASRAARAPSRDATVRAEQHG